MPAPRVVEAERLQAGRVELEFAPAGGRTELRRARSSAPVKVLQPRHAGPSAWACLSSLGGGLVDGDGIRVEVSARRGSSAALTTQASTKVYRGAASQAVQAAVEDSALLVVAPDPVVCYAGSGYAQRQTFELSPRADLVVVDWLTSGRSAREERWAFASYEASLNIRRDGKDELREALRLHPEAGPLAPRLGRWELLGLAVVCGPRLAAGACRLAAELGELPLSRRAGLVLTAAPFGDSAVLLRLAACSIEEGQAALRRSLSFVWRLLGDDPWSCRYS